MFPTAPANVRQAGKRGGPPFPWRTADAAAGVVRSRPGEPQGRGCDPEGVIRRRVVVHGFVQGVGFRVSLARAADSRGVAGWVRNRPDGAVEAVLEGEPAAVGSVVRWCGDGPRGAEVSEVETFAEEAEGLSGFTVRG